MTAIVNARKDLKMPHRIAPFPAVSREDDVTNPPSVSGNSRKRGERFFLFQFKQSESSGCIECRLDRVVLKRKLSVFCRKLLLIFTC